MENTVYILFQDREVRSVYNDAEVVEEALLNMERLNPSNEFYVESYGVIS